MPTPTILGSYGDIPLSFMPSYEQTQFGSASYGVAGSTFNEEGNIFRFCSAGVNPATTGSDIVVLAFTLAPNVFDGLIVNGIQSYRGLTFGMQGSFANNTNVKTAKIIFNATTAVVGSAVTGGTTVVTTGAYSTAALTPFVLQGSVFKYGAAGSNTQMCLPQGVILAAAHQGVGTGVNQQAATAVESGAILCAFTINCATTATDASIYWAEINAMN